jgi:adenosylhomocysteine nucleosidase
LPPAALIALDAAGAIGAGQVLASVLAWPGQIPALLRLASDAARARKSLALSAASLYWPGRDPSDR